MNPPTTEETQKIHGQYCALTGLQIPFSMQVHFSWESWLSRGWTEPDLACVVRYIKQRIKEHRREKESLLLRNLIARTDNFAEELAISRATARNERTETPRSEILRAVGRSEQPKNNCKPVKDILAGHQAFLNWKQQMEREGLA